MFLYALSGWTASLMCSLCGELCKWHKMHSLELGGQPAHWPKSIH